MSKKSDAEYLDESDMEKLRVFDRMRVKVVEDIETYENELRVLRRRLKWVEGKMNNVVFEAKWRPIRDIFGDLEDEKRDEQ